MADVENMKRDLADSLKSQKSELDKAVEGLLETTEKALNATTKRQMRKYQKMREQQQAGVDALMGDFENVLEVASDGLEEVDEDMYTVFVQNRKKDIKLYDTAYTKQMRKQTKTMKGFFDKAEDAIDSLKEDFGGLADVVNALNINSIKDSIEGGTQGTVDYIRSIQKDLNLTDQEMSEMKKMIKQSASDLSDEFGGMISSADLTEAIEYAVSDVGIRDKELASAIGQQLSVYKKATGLDYDTINELVNAVWKNEWDPAVITQITDDMKKLSTTYAVSDEALAGAVNGIAGQAERLANGDVGKYIDLQERAMKAATMMEDSSLDSEKVFEKFGDYASGGAEGIQSFYSDLSWLQSYGGVDLQQMYNDLQNGMYDRVASAYLEGIKNIDASGVYDNNPVMREMISESLGVTEEEWERVTSSISEGYVEEMNNQMDQVIKDNKNGVKQAINESSYKKWYQKLADKFGLSGLGMDITNFIDGLDLDLSDVILGGGAVKSIIKGLKGKGEGWFGKAMGTVGSKMGSWFTGTKFGSAVANAMGKVNADQVAKVFGTSVDDVVETFGKKAAYSLDDLAEALGTSADDVAKVFTKTASSSTDDVAKAATEAAGKAAANYGDDVVKGASKAGGTALSNIFAALGFAVDGVFGAFKTDDWFGEDAGVGDYVSSILGSIVGGTGSGIAGDQSGLEKGLDIGGNTLKWAAGGAAIGSVVPGLGTAIGGGVGAIIGAVTGLIGGENISKGIDWLGEKIGEGGEWLGEKLESAGDVFSEKVKGAGDWIAETWKSFKGGASDAWEGIKEGASKAWDWATGMIYWLPGHANGLDYVPYDNYVARLHRGERVLTAKENEEYNEDKSDKDFREPIKSALISDDVMVPFVKEFTELFSKTLTKQADITSTLTTGSPTTGSSGFLGNIFSGIGNFFSGIFGGGSTGGGGSHSTGAIQDGGSNEKTTFNYLKGNMGLNNAGAAGVLANINEESGFNPNALGDGGTSYGICQWHNSRWDSLKSFCNNNGYDWKSLDGQLRYLEYELKKSYSGVWSTISSVKNNAQGAYDAAYKWCTDFEVPADKDTRGAQRGETAKSYFQKYSSYDVGTPWVPEDQLAMVHEGEMIVPKKYNPINSEAQDTQVAAESSGTMPAVGNGDVIDVLRQGFQYIGRKIEDLEIKVNQTVASAAGEAESPAYYVRGGII